MSDKREVWVSANGHWYETRADAIAKYPGPNAAERVAKYVHESAIAQARAEAFEEAAKIADKEAADFDRCESSPIGSSSDGLMAEGCRSVAKAIRAAAGRAGE